MTETALTTRTNAANAAIMERVLVVGDLAQLTAQERVSYYRSVCESIGLNPLTKPFDYINLNGKLTLYAKKDAADQLRNINSVSIGKPDIQFQDDLIIVTVEATNGKGRTDSDVGIVKKTDMRGDVANAVMKAVTKAKRRVTLSLCGLGWLDETEVETIPDAKPVIVAETGEIVTTAKTVTKQAPTELTTTETKPTPTPASIRASIAKSGATWNIAAWRSVHNGVIDMATNYGVTSVDLAAHTVPGDVVSKTELETHTVALLDLCEAMATPLPA